MTQIPTSQSDEMTNPISLRIQINSIEFPNNDTKDIKKIYFIVQSEEFKKKSKITDIDNWEPQTFKPDIKSSNSSVKIYLLSGSNEQTLAFGSISLGSIIQDSSGEKTEKLELTPNETKGLSAKLTIKLTWKAKGETQAKTAPKKELITIAQADYTGILKVVIIGGDKLLLNKDSNSSSSESINISIGNQQFSSDVNGMTLISRKTHYFEVKPSNKILKLEMNIKKGTTNQIVAKYQEDLANMNTLSQAKTFKEFTLGSQFHQNYEPKILLEMYFLVNYFVNYPDGYITITPKILYFPDKTISYYKFKIDNATEKIIKLGQVSNPMKVSSAKDILIIEYCEKNGIMNKIRLYDNIGYKTEWKSEIPLCELDWKEIDPGTSLSKLSKTMELKNIKKDIRLEILFKSSIKQEEYISPTNMVAPIKSEKRTPDLTRLENENPIEEPNANVIPIQKSDGIPSRKISTDKEIKKTVITNIDNISEKSMNKIVRIQEISLIDYPPNLKLFDSPNYYMLFIIEGTTYKYITSISKNHPPEWPKEDIILPICGANKKITIYLKETSFSIPYSAYSNSMSEIICGSFCIENKEDNLYLFQTLDVQIGNDYQNFLKKYKSSIDDTASKNLKNTKIKIRYDIIENIFIEQPIGLFTVHFVDASKMRFAKKEDSDSLSGEMILSLSLGSQIYVSNDDTEKKSNFKWDLKANFQTMNIFDTLIISMYCKYRSETKLLFQVPYELNKMKLELTQEIAVDSINLHNYSNDMGGDIILTFSYLPLIDNSYNLIKEIPINEKNFAVKNANDGDKQTLSLLELFIAEAFVYESFGEEFKIWYEFKLGNERYITSKYENPYKITINEKYYFSNFDIRNDKDILIISLKAINPKNKQIVRINAIPLKDHIKLMAQRTFIKVILAKDNVPKAGLNNYIVLGLRLANPEVQINNVGFMKVEPIEIRSVGLNLDETVLWKNMVAFVLKISLNGTRYFFRAIMDYPKEQVKLYVIDNINSGFCNASYDTTKFFIDKEESMIPTFDVRKSNFWFPTYKKDDKVRIKLYMIENPGEAIDYSQLDENDTAYVIANGAFCLYELANKSDSKYALHLSRQSRFIYQTDSDPNTDFIKLYLVFNVEFDKDFDDSMIVKSPKNPIMEINIPKDKDINNSIDSKNSKVAPADEKSLIVKGMDDNDKKKSSKIEKGAVSIHMHKLFYTMKKANDCLGYLIDADEVKEEDTNKYEDDINLMQLRNFLHCSSCLHNYACYFHKNEFLTIKKSPFEFELKTWKIEKKNKREIESISKTKLQLIENSNVVTTEEINPILNESLYINCPIKDKDIEIGRAGLVLTFKNNFFCELPEGYVKFKKFSFSVDRESDVENIRIIEIRITNLEDDKFSEAFKIRLSDFIKHSCTYSILENFGLGTRNELDVLNVYFKNGNDNVIAQAKIKLFDIPFKCPHSDDYDALDIPYTLLVPLPSKSNSKAKAIINMQFLYRDRTTEFGAHFHSFKMLLKFRKFITEKLDFIRRIVYWNPTTQPLIFNGKFARRIFNDDRYYGEKLPVWLAHKLGQYLCNIDDEPKTPDIKSALEVKIQKKIKFMLPGTLSSKHELKMILSYQLMVDGKRTLITYSKSLIIDDHFYYAYTTKDDNPYSELTFMKPVEFFIDEIQAVEKKFNLDIEYYEKGNINRKIYGKIDLVSLFLNQKDHIVDVNYFVMMKPSNNQLRLTINLISNEFINNAHGILTLQFHRLVKLVNPHKDTKGLVESNQNLCGKVDKKENPKTKQKDNNNDSTFENLDLYNFSYKVNTLIEKQNFSSSYFNYQGIPIQKFFEEASFYLSDYKANLEFDIILNNAEDISQAISQNKNESFDPSSTKKESYRKPIVASGSLSLSHAGLKPNEKYFFYIPLDRFEYRKNDLMKTFLDSIDRDNIYLLGCLTFKPKPWIVVNIKPKNIKNVFYLGDFTDDFGDYDLILKISFKCKQKEISRYRIIYQTEKVLIENQAEAHKKNYTFNDDQQIDFIYEPEDTDEDLIGYINIEGSGSSGFKDMATCTLLLNKIMNNGTTVVNTIMLLPLQPMPAIASKLPSDVNEMPMKTEINISKSYESHVQHMMNYPRKTKQKEIEFDFREQEISGIFIHLINARDTNIIKKALKEIGEFLLFSNKNNLTNLPINSSIRMLEIFRITLRLYGYDLEISNLCAKNLLNLIMFDPSLWNQIDIIYDLIRDLQELCLIIVKSNNIAFLGATSEFIQYYKNYQFEFTDPQNLKLENYNRNLGPLDTLDVFMGSIEKIFQNMANNILSPQFHAKPDLRSNSKKFVDENSIGEILNDPHLKELASKAKPLKRQATLKPERGFSKALTKDDISTDMISYIMKIISFYISNADDNIVKFIEMLYFPLNYLMDSLINNNQALTHDYIKILWKIISKSLYNLDIQFNDRNIEIMIDTLTKIEFNKCGLSSDLSMLIFILEKNLNGFISKKINGNKIEAYCIKVFKWFDMNYNSTEFEFAKQFLVLLNEVTKLLIANDYPKQIVQNIINTVSVFPKLINYLQLVGKRSSDRIISIDKDTNLFFNIYEDLLAHYDLPNFSKMNFLISLQELSSRPGLLERTKERILNFIMILKSTNDDDARRKRIEYLLSKKKEADNKPKDLNLKYSIAKLDWLKKK